MVAHTSNSRAQAVRQEDREFKDSQVYIEDKIDEKNGKKEEETNYFYN